MLLLFAIVFVVSINFGILFFLTFPGDREQNNKSINRTLRPFYLITLAIVFWAMTYPMLLAPDAITTVMPSFTITSNSATAGNTLYTFTAYNVITNTNYPLATQSFYAYLPIYTTVLIIYLVILIMYILEYTADTFDKEVMNK